MGDHIVSGKTGGGGSVVANRVKRVESIKLAYN